MSIDGRQAQARGLPAPSPDGDGAGGCAAAAAAPLADFQPSPQGPVRDGFAAHVAGHPWRANPYRYPLAREAWLDGWEAAWACRHWSEGDPRDCPFSLFAMALDRFEADWARRCAAVTAGRVEHGWIAEIAQGKARADHHGQPLQGRPAGR